VLFVATYANNDKEIDVLSGGWAHAAKDTKGEKDTNVEQPRRARVPPL
jgi:hypothetical protein